MANDIVFSIFGCLLLAVIFLFGGVWQMSLLFLAAAGWLSWELKRLED